MYVVIANDYKRVPPTDTITWRDVVHRVMCVARLLKYVTCKIHVNVTATTMVNIICYCLEFGARIEFKKDLFLSPTFKNTIMCKIQFLL